MNKRFHTAKTQSGSDEAGIFDALLEALVDSHNLSGQSGNLGILEFKI